MPTIFTTLFDNFKLLKKNLPLRLDSLPKIVTKTEILLWQDIAMWHWFVALSRPLDSVRWAAAIAQVVIPIFSQKFPACLAGSLMMKCVILTNVRTLLLSFLSIHNLHISNGLHQIWKSCHILATSKTLFFSFWFNLRLIKKWQFLHRNTDYVQIWIILQFHQITTSSHIFL